MSLNNFKAFSEKLLKSRSSSVLSNINGLINRLTFSKSVSKQDQENIEDGFEEILNRKPYVNQEINFLRSSRDLFKSLKSFQERFSEDLPLLTNVNTLSLHYFLEQNETVHTPSWKRRIHTYAPKVPPSVLDRICTDLIYSYLVYEDMEVTDLEKTLQLVHDHQPFSVFDRNQSRIKNYLLSLSASDDTKQSTAENQNKLLALLPIKRKETETIPLLWKVLHFERTATLSKPAYFVAFADNETKKQKELLFVVRGTYSVEDVITNNEMEFTPLYEGMVHRGFAEAADFLIKEFGDLIESIDAYNISNSSLFNKPVKVKFVGHSMGGAIASIMALKLKREGRLKNVEVVTFGCPPTFSSELIAESKKFTTSVVCDDDIVSRLTDISVKKLGNELLKFDWKEYLERDIDRFLSNYGKILPSALKKNTNLQTFLKTKILNVFPDNRERKLKLINTEQSSLGHIAEIPGRIIHIFRTGRGFAAVEAEQSVFRDINFSRTMIDDHLLKSYFEALTECK